MPWSSEGAPEGRDNPACPAWSRLGIALCDQHCCLPPYRELRDRVSQGAPTSFLLLVQIQSIARGRRNRQEEEDRARPGQARDRREPCQSHHSPCQTSVAQGKQRRALRPLGSSTQTPSRAVRPTVPEEASMRTRAHTHTPASGLAAPSQLRCGVGCSPTAK